MCAWLLLPSLLLGWDARGVLADYLSYPYPCVLAREKERTIKDNVLFKCLPRIPSWSVASPFRSLAAGPPMWWGVHTATWWLL